MAREANMAPEPKLGALVSRSSSRSSLGAFLDGSRMSHALATDARLVPTMVPWRAPPPNEVGRIFALSTLYHYEDRWGQPSSVQLIEPSSTNEMHDIHPMHAPTLLVGDLYIR